MTDALWQILGAIVVGALSAGSAYFIAIRNIRLQTNVATNSAGDALRDDLMGLIDRYEKREQWLTGQIVESNKRNEELQVTITGLRTEVTALRNENIDLKTELRKTQADLAAFDKKVYYIPNKPQE